MGVAFNKTSALIEIFEKRITTAMVAEYGLDAATMTLGESVDLLTADFLANAAAWATTPFGMITIAVGAIYGIIKAVDLFTVTAEEAREELESLSQTSTEADNNIESIKSQLADTQEEINKLNAQKLELTNAKDKQNLEDSLISLKAQSAELRTQLEIEKEKQRIAHEEEEKQAVETASKKEDSFSLNLPMSEYKGYAASNWDTITGTAEEQMAQSLEKYKEYQERIREINQNIIEAEASGNTELVQKLSENRDAWENNLDELKVHMSDMNTNLETTKQSIYGVTDSGQELKNNIINLQEEYANLIGLENEGIDITQDSEAQYEELASKIEGGKDAIEEYAEANGYLDDVEAGTEDYTNALISAGLALQEANENQEDFNDTLGNVASNLSSLASEYNSLSEAINDFNDGNGISLDSLEAITNAVINHTGALSFENGQIQLSEGYFQALADAQIDEAEAALMDKAQTELNAIAHGEYEEILNSVATASSNAAVKEQQAGNAALEAGQNASIGAEGFKEFWAATEGEDYTFVTSKQNRAKAIVKEQTEATYNALESLRGNFDSTASSIAKSSGSAAKSSEDAWLKAYKAEKETIDAMYENGTLSAEQYQEKLLELQAKYLTDTKEHQEKYASEIKSLYEDIYKALKDSVKDSLDEMKDAHDKAEDALKKQHEAQEKSIKNQIELLKRQKEAVEDSYDAQIEALKREREEYENQLELMKLKESLAKAQQQYQYVMNENGRFEWTQDQNAVDEAQEELYEEQLKQAYEKQLQDLEDAKDAAVALYEQQIQDLEDYYDQVQEANDEAEEALEAHNEAIEEQYEKAIEDFDLYAEMLNNGQLAQIESENANWATRLTNLAQFVNSYNAMLAELGNEGATVSPSASFSGGSSSKSSSKTTSGSTTKYKMKKAKVLDVKKHASGVSSISDDELALVGDSPNQELVIGSKLNGVPLTLTSGSGVVNAKSTKSLAGLLNSIPNLGNNYNTTNNNSQHSIHIDTINLPQVQNGNDFVDYLQNFNVDMTANAYRFGS